MVGQIIGAHPKALLLDEDEGLMDWVWALVANHSNRDKLFRDLIKRAVTKYHPGYPKIVGNFLRNTRLSPNVSHLVLKAPNLTYHHHEFASLGYDISVINPVRDVRAVVASMEALGTVDIVQNQLRLLKKVHQDTGRYASEIAFLEDPATPVYLKRALIWEIKSTAHRQYSEAELDPLVFRYEDCVADPLGYAHQLAEHVGLEFTPEMTNHSSVLHGRGPGLLRRNRPIDNRSVEKWRDHLTTMQERQILDQTASAMKSLGYSSCASREAESYVNAPVKPLRDDPIIVTGRGGSGTRLISKAVQDCGVFLGNRLNESEDSMEWVEAIYEIAAKVHTAEYEPSDSEEIDWQSRLALTANRILQNGGIKQDQLWGFKLPESMLIMPQLLSTFPNARVIHLVRHPITSSLRRTHLTSQTANPVGKAVCEAAYRDAGMEPSNALIDPDWKRNALTWNYQVGSVANQLGEMPADRSLQVKFEDLCDDPQEVTNEIKAFLDGGSRISASIGIQAKRRKPRLGFFAPKEKIWEYCGATATKIGYTFT